MRERLRSPLAGVAVAALAVGAITLLIYPLDNVLPVVSTGVFYLLAVLLVSTFWPLWLGLATCLASALAFNFFHIPPTGRFTIASSEDWVALGAFFVAAVVTSSLANLARARALEAERRRREADLLAEVARVLLAAREVDESCEIVAGRISQAFDLPSVTVELGSAQGDERRQALPLIAEGERVATLLVAKDEHGSVPVGLHRVAPALATLLAVVISRGELEREVSAARALARGERGDQP